MKRGVDAFLNHHLVTATHKLRPKRCTVQRTLEQDTNNVDYLKHKETADSYWLNLSNRFQILQELYDDNSTNTEAEWIHAKQMWTQACEEVVGRKTTQYKEWMTPVTLEKIQKRKQTKAFLNNSRTRTEKTTAQRMYKEAHGEVKKNIRADKRGHTDNLESQAEQAAAQRNMKGL